MTIYVFTGPTLSADDGRRVLGAIYLPPAAQGDLYRAARERPVAIGLIDGYFERVPSVAHKEILWAMAQGVHVFGSASMGALRAAELALFGMEGVGAVFEAFRSGELERDDEVAVAHASAEDGFRPVSEAMVNIRATLEAAEAAGVLDAPLHAELRAIGRALFYPDRCYPILLARAAEAGLDPAALGRLEVFLRTGRVNRKRDDALAMLRVMSARFAPAGGDQALPAPKRVDYAFAHTDAWETIRASTPALPGEEDRPHALPAELLEELRVRGSLAQAMSGAMARALAVEAAARQGRAMPAGALQGAVDAFRRDRGLFDPPTFQAWAAEQGLGDLERFFKDEADVRWAAVLHGAGAARQLADHLRSTGDYGPLLARARDKARALAGRAPETDAGVHPPFAELFRWYFEERLRRPVPADLAVYARSAGFDDEAALRRDVLRERAYLALAAPS